RGEIEKIMGQDKAASSRQRGVRRRLVRLREKNRIDLINTAISLIVKTVTFVFAYIRIYTKRSITDCLSFNSILGKWRTE
ncbi:MAG: hypothetical protein LPK14_00890, partial [Hymenobacteraceae bacterium]|nr:hypothetical protein [Hymenobacteraceae bacterium]